MKSTAKRSQLQIRVSREQKIAIRRAAGRAGLGMSQYVLSRLLSIPAESFQDRMRELGAAKTPPFALAELHDLLGRLSAYELREAIDAPPEVTLSPYLANYVAAMVETACALKSVPIPVWVRGIVPLSEPVFATDLQSLRLYLLTHAPPAFRARNLFVDSTIGARV